MSTDEYDVYALRYSGKVGRKSEDFFRYGVYGDPDETHPMDFYFWLLRNEDRTVLLDTGFDAEQAARRGRSHETHPLELLSRLGVRPADVDHVILSHMHYDHIGNVLLYPNATFTLAREEFDFWTGPYGSREIPARVGIPEEVDTIRKLVQEERVGFVDDTHQVFPGILATRLGGHTAGQLMVEASARSGRHVVLASDALHFYEEMERDRLYSSFTELEATYRAYEVFRDLQSREDTSIVAGHDPRVRSLFRPVDTDCFDLGQPTA